MTTLYDELGVARDATQHELRRAYREQARRLHPDVNPGPEAENAIRRLNEIWSVLGDPTARRLYDATLRAPVPSGGRAGPIQPRLKKDPQPRWLWFVRPSMLVLAVLGIIFLVTAYAGPHAVNNRSPLATTATSAPSPITSTAMSDTLIGKCVLVQPGYDAVTPCSQPNNGQVVAEVAQLSQCPPGSTGYQLTGRAQLVCLVGPR